MSIDDVKKYQSQCRKELGQWDTVALQDGTVDGEGYGYKYHKDDKRRCTIGTRLLMVDDGREDAFPYCGETCRKTSGAIPDGWVVMTIDDVKKYQSKCRR